MRHAFHTCYYCAVTTDHQEELQRKCIQHLRKPLSKATYDEYKAKMAENFAKVKEESSVQEDGDLKPKEEEPSSDDRGKDTKDEDTREWKKSGAFSLFSEWGLSQEEWQRTAGLSGWIPKSLYCSNGTLSTLVRMVVKPMMSEFFVL
jgi:hypothetical protein